MARFKDGLLGAFTGKAGNIVASMWRNIRVVKAAGPSTRNNNSPAQVEQQARFNLASSFVRNMSELFDLTYESVADQMTAQNKAIGAVVKEAIIGDYPNFTIDYPEVVVSRGSLKKERKQDITVTVAAGILTWKWKYVQRKLAKSVNTDKVFLLAYCPAFDSYEVEDFGPGRTTNLATLNVTSFVGQTVETWIAFVSVDKKKFSDSVYTGQVAVV